MRATAEPVEGNRVRLSVEVDEGEIDEALDATVQRLARQVRVPGFRPGRVPRPVLEARLGGAEALRQQALSDALPDLYARAVQDTEVDPISAPEIDITSGENGGPITFDALVEVRPTVTVPGYKGLVVTVPALAVTDDEVGRQVDRIR
jgi:trigger factor